MPVYPSDLPPCPTCGCGMVDVSTHMAWHARWALVAAAVNIKV